MKSYPLIVTAMLLAACQDPGESASRVEMPVRPSAEAGETSSPNVAFEDALMRVLEAQPADVQARYVHRHPRETLLFLGIEPGMTVVEGLPGGGWYTRLLINYLGADGRLIGGNYSMDMYPLFPFADEAFLARQAAWAENFGEQAQSWSDVDAASVDAFYFGSMPADLAGVADVVFFPRVLHNPANFQNAGKGNFFDEVLADAYTALKPGGIFGVVQHEARDDTSDAFASGAAGYLRKDWLITRIEEAGFEFVADTDINANDKDRPGENDIVWRLPPTYSGSEEGSKERAAVDAIGESNRMTLKFRKPL